MTNVVPTKKDLLFLLEQQDPMMLKNVWIPEAERVIKLHKMPYKIASTDPLELLKIPLEQRVLEVGESTDAWLSRFVTQDKQMLQVKEDIRRLAQINDDKDQLFCVLISGPTGTGKELLALALHGERVNNMISINCAGLPSELVESELFGHEMGAFTGVTKKKEGLMKMANKGTLFLDEIGELPLPSQAKLLRAIQSKRVRKVGGEKDEQVDCRIVCATHRDLKDMIRLGQFREDLYARISTFEVRTTALYDRMEDIKLICSSIDKEFVDKIGDHIYNMNLQFNVRSIQQHIKRYKILGKLPV